MAKPPRPDYNYTAPDGTVLEIIMDPARLEQVIAYARLPDGSPKDAMVAAFTRGLEDSLELDDLERHKSSAEELLETMARQIRAQDLVLMDVIRAYKPNLSQDAQNFCFPGEKAEMGAGHRRISRPKQQVARERTVDNRFETTIPLVTPKGKTVDVPINGTIIRILHTAIINNQTGRRSKGSFSVMTSSADIHEVLSGGDRGDDAFGKRVKAAGLEYGDYIAQLTAESRKGDEGHIPELFRLLDTFVQENINSFAVDPGQLGFVYGEKGRMGGGSRKRGG